MATFPSLLACFIVVLAGVLASDALAVTTMIHGCGFELSVFLGGDPVKRRSIAYAAELRSGAIADAVFA